jgi:hypothetical protein
LKHFCKRYKRNKKTEKEKEKEEKKRKINKETGGAFPAQHQRQPAAHHPFSRSGIPGPRPLSPTAGPTRRSSSSLDRKPRQRPSPRCYSSLLIPLFISIDCLPVSSPRHTYKYPTHSSLISLLIHLENRRRINDDFSPESTAPTSVNRRFRLGQENRANHPRPNLDVAWSRSGRFSSTLLDAFEPSVHADEITVTSRAPSTSSPAPGSRRTSSPTDSSAAPHRRRPNPSPRGELSLSSSVIR